MKICLLSYSAIADDPRVRRQGDALQAAGHEVIGIGLSGSLSPRPSWTIVDLDRPPRTVAARAHLALGASVGSRTACSERAYWGFRIHREFVEAATRVGADLYLANDWKVLPAAARAAGRLGSRYAYDSHEYAVEEGGDRASWRSVFQRYVRDLEGTYIQGACFVTTVGGAIADLLASNYRLERRPMVVRNMPNFEEMTYRAVGDQATVLYHGIYAGDRCLTELIDSVSDWDPRYRLVLRGYGTPGIERTLRSRAAESPVSARVSFAPRVPMTELVRQANDADIGVFATPATTNHTRLCLPNKVFEYMMAGLALCVSDNVEMGALVREWGVGALIDTPSPAGIARALNRLTPEAIGEFKRSSLTAARTLNWEHEQHVLLDAVATLGRTA